ncbi:hypothetical protein [Lolliginicoccus suaedae]|uniref:hypothetical protein n=1 Tax=Lolliginicoccus suaedae TaxID=2605429 RepID=UPI0011EFA379|nr:hypothetical protein [Lolliginicoccus suaedae]
MTSTWPGSTYDCAAPAPTTSTARPAASGGLGLSTPMTMPACDGTGIVILHSAITPGQYANEVQNALDTHPGARYLRTDQSCPSLRQSYEGNPIYAVYYPAGTSRTELCARVRTVGGDAYGRWLDTTSDPSELVTC